MSSIHPAWQRPGMPGLAGIMFLFRRTAGREDSRVDKEREVLKKVNAKMRQQMATGNKRLERFQALRVAVFFQI